MAELFMKFIILCVYVRERERGRSWMYSNKAKSIDVADLLTEFTYLWVHTLVKIYDLGYFKPNK